MRTCVVSGVLANSPDPAVNADDPVFVTAIQEQLGLKLEPGRALLQTLVIEHIERPSEN